MNGVLNLNKPKGCSSHDMVYFARRLFNTKKAGHTGTLDPITSGVLPVLVGSATKLSDLLLAQNKSYRAVLKLGYFSDTMDITGNVTYKTNVLPGFEKVEEAAKSFVGPISQMPPSYSAIKIKGKKLYEYAREGAAVEISPRAVTIYSINCKKKEAAKAASFFLQLRFHYHLNMITLVEQFFGKFLNMCGCDTF
jgi:tRNA pseudouridine55 synthase